MQRWWTVVLVAVLMVGCGAARTGGGNDDDENNAKANNNPANNNPACPDPCEVRCERRAACLGIDEEACLVVCAANPAPSLAELECSVDSECADVEACDGLEGEAAPAPVCIAPKDAMLTVTHDSAQLGQAEIWLDGRFLLTLDPSASASAQVRRRAANVSVRIPGASADLASSEIEIDGDISLRITGSLADLVIVAE